MLKFNPIMVDNYAAFFNCMGRASDSKAIHFRWLVQELLVCCLALRDSSGVFLLLRIFSKLLGAQGISIVGQPTESVSRRF